MPKTVTSNGKFSLNLLCLAFLLSSFSSAKAQTPGVPACRQQAVVAINDLIGHFWQGPPDSGEIVTDSHHRLTLAGRRRSLWARGMFYIALENFYQITKDPTVGERLRAEWNHSKQENTDAEAEAVGEHSHTNFASDDSGWCAMVYLAAYRATGDPVALERARGIVNNAYARWMDDQLGGGIWYADPGHKVKGVISPRDKSLYATGLVYASVRLYAITHEHSFLDRALLCYNWMESHLRREDNLYWCGYNVTGPVGASRPNDVHEAGSVTFLSGNMGMGVLHALLFRLTGDDIFRQRALRTATALCRGLLVNADGVFIDDRDAWTNGTFAGEWVREVLTLPGISPADKEVLCKTATSIFTKARTADGFYGGSWSGPAQGEGSRWFRGGSTPQQIMTSASSVNMIVAAAALSCSANTP